MTDFGVSVVTEREVDDAGDPASSGDGEFFIVDRRAFAAACKLGLNPAVAYLTIARGAGNRRTSLWSVDAIERHTGISRPKAKLAVNTVIENGLLTLERRGTRPVYGIVAVHELPGMTVSAKDRIVIDLFGEADRAQIPYVHLRTATDLIHRGFLKDDGKLWFSKTDLDFPSEKPQLIWLPNSIVDGVADEIPPLALIRQMQDVRRLQLFVALYDNNDLPNDGGVSRKILRKEHVLTKLSQRGELTIWRFKSEGSITSSRLLYRFFASGQLGDDGEDIGMPDFWATLNTFEDCGLFAFIPHVFESAKPESEVLHAYPVRDGAGEGWERGVADVADAAARSLLAPEQQKWAVENDYHFLSVPSHITSLAVIGVARLRYRPQTRKTAAWFAMSKARSEAWQSKYELIIRSQDPVLSAQRDESGKLQHKGRDKRGINGVIKGM